MTPRVVHVIDPEPEGTIGGADLHVVDLARAQREHGAYEPFVLCTESREYEARLVKAGIPYLSHPRSGRYWRHSSEMSHLPTAIRARLVHSHGYDANYLVCWLRLLYSEWACPRLVMTCHGWIETTPTLKLKTWLDFRMYRTADALIACSADQLPRLNGLRGSASFVPNGVRQPADDVSQASVFRRRFGIPDGRRLIAFIGRLSAEKRPDLFVDVTVRLLQRIPDVHVVVVGGGEWRARVERLFEDRHAGDRVTFTGLIEDTYEVYPHVHLLLVTSETETTSRVAMEALIHGVPVVASRVGGLPYVVRHEVDGYLCDYGDIDEMTGHAASLLTDTSLWRTFSRAGQQRARDTHAIAVMRQRVEAIYDAVVSHDTKQ